MSRVKFLENVSGWGLLDNNLMKSVLQKDKKDELNMPPKSPILRCSPPVNRQEKETGRVTRDRG